MHTGGNDEPKGRGAACLLLKASSCPSCVRGVGLAYGLMLMLFSLGAGGVGWGGVGRPPLALLLRMASTPLSRVGGWGGAFLLRMALCSCSCREGWAGGAGRGRLVADGFMFMLLSRGVGGWGLLVADGAEQVAEGGVVVLAALHQRPDEARVHAAVPPPWFGL